MKILFAFHLDTDTQEAQWTGNIEPMGALLALQQMVVTQLAQAQIEQQQIADIADGIEGGKHEPRNNVD